MTLLKNGSSISAARAQAACRPSIRPFVCSTFRDFGSERDFLQEHIFPKLDKFCRERGSRFCPVDLRWNKSQSQLGSDHVLRLCLDSIALCAPYFICILGERYGVHRSAESEPLDSVTNDWLDKNFEVAAACGHEWVLEEDNKYISLTELEIIQSSFRKKYDHGYFYFRNPAHLEDRLKEAPLTEHSRIKVNCESESDYCARKMKELKQQIIDTELPVRHFRTLDELGELVSRDWMSLIDNLYPSIDTSVFRHVDSEDFQEWGAHEMFAETRRKMFCRNLKIREMGEALSNHAEVGQGIKKKTSMVLPTVMTSTFITSLPGADKDALHPLMVLAGDRGCGKTSLVANWLKQFSSAHPEVPVIPHYVGSSAYSYDVSNFMRRCTKELRLHYLNTDYDDLMENKDITDFKRVTEAFHAALSLGPCVILIDGADDFGGSADVPAFIAKEMQWLPAQIPSTCRTIITTSKADITFRALCMRKDAYVVAVPQLFDSKAKRTLLREYVGINSKFLNEDHAGRIISAKLSDLPLFYVAISNELRLFHGYKNAERQLDAYIQASNLGELWSLILRRWARDYGWLMPAATRGPASIKAQVSRDRSNSGWVADTLRLVAISRNGLTVEEVLGSLNVMGYARNHEVTTAHWTLFNLASQNVLVATSQGLLTFCHQSFRGAVESALLRSLTSPSQERIVSPFKEVWERQKQQCHNVLANYFSAIQPATARTVEELPWQYRMSRNVNGLSKSLSNPGTFVRLTSTRELNKKMDILSYWKSLEDGGQSPVELLQQIVRDSLGKVESVSDSRRDVSSAVSRTEELSSIEVLCNKMEGDCFTEMEVSIISFFSGKLLAEQNQHVAAEELLLSAYKYGYTVASVKDLDIICRVQESLGNLYLRLCMKESAEYWYRGALKTAAEQTRVTDKVHHEARVGRILNQLGIILLGNTSSPPSPSEDKVRARASARIGRPKTPSTQRSSSAASRKKSEIERANFKEIGPLLNESLKHVELARVVPGKTAVYFQMGLCAFGQKQYGDAELLFRKALSMREQWYGSSHPLVAEIIETMATLFSLDGLDNSDPVLAEKMYRKALRMREESFGPSDIAVADTLVNLGKLLQQKSSKDSTREAKQLLQRALDIRTAKLGVYHMTSKLVRRYLMSLETVDAAAKLSSKGSGRELKSLESAGIPDR